MPKYAELIYSDYSFSPQREMLQAAIDQSQRYVPVRCRLKLYKGNVISCSAATANIHCTIRTS